MKSKFKHLSISKESIYTILRYDDWTFKKGNINIFPFLKSYEQKVTIFIHNGKLFSLLKWTILNNNQLLSENYFFTKKLKFGNFIFTKKHCVFKSKKKNKWEVT